MKRLFIILTLASSLAGQMSCDKIDTACDEIKPTSALVDSLPDSIKVGEPYIVNIDYVLENSCGSFEKFETTNTGDKLQIQLITKYAGCNCDQTFSEELAQFNLLLEYPGYYSIEFWEDDDDYNTFLIKAFE
ncbi:MAG: hypothetical protein MK078_17735 [Crocinitomicaceae bacterium]|nr:hypothetical protein [Crocinitomicaceae bacterium]